MEYSLNKIPFSTYGSYLVISGIEDKGIYLRDLHGGDEAPSSLYRISMTGHREEEVEIIRTEMELTLNSRKAEGGYASFVMGKEDIVYCRICGVGLELDGMGGRYNTLVPVSESQYEHHLYDKQLKIMFTRIQGTMKQEQKFEIIGSRNVKITLNNGGTGAESYIVIEGYRTVWKKKNDISYEEAKTNAEQSFQEWSNLFNGFSGKQEEQKKLASYLTYINTVRAEGSLTSDAMYMSKNWMNNIWSWDNCFGAILLSEKKPELAYGQMKIFFDHQDESGCYPDYVNETFASYNCVKPPIFSWAYEKMRKQNDYFNDKERLREVYESLCKVTSYWFQYRSNERAEFPVYYHGNDSGWDNASVFHKGFPVESPDLTAFLIYQMDWLCKTAWELGNQKAGEEWKNKADEAFSRFMKHFYIDGKLRAYYVPGEQPILEGDSLLMYLPILIGYRMGKDILEKMVQDLEEHFEAAYGLATEALDSIKYKEGGYWLGPVWAPTTYLFIDALAANGYQQMAGRLGEKFCRAAKIGLMAENYNPFTGEGYDDPAFSWSSCVFLQLMKEYCNDSESIQ